jgi:protease-4
MRGSGSMRAMRSGPLLFAALSVALGLCVAGDIWAGGPAGLPDYPSEVEILVDTPGTSGSVAAGLFNPAAWPLQSDGGAFLAWDDLRGSDAGNWTAVLSTGHLGFGWRRFHFGPACCDSRIDDYTIGLGSGTRSGSYGLSYSWGAGDTKTSPRHERITLGSISRWRSASFGASETLDLESRNNYFQFDLGIRPLGPRLTMFGDAVYGYGKSFGDSRTGYGLEAKLIPGLAVAAKMQNTGEFSFRVSVDLFRKGSVSYRPHFDDDSKLSSSTYAVESGPYRPTIGHGHLAVGRSYPIIDLKGGVAYQRYRLFDERRTLLGTLKQIASYADDPAVGGVVVSLSGMRLNYEMAWEMAKQFEGLRARGKKVIVYFDRVSLPGCALASVADQVWMDPLGDIDIAGMNIGRTYYKHALEKMGIGFDEWRFFKYKSAAESFSRDSLSDADREQLQAITDDFYETERDIITSARGISYAQFDEIVNQKGFLLPEEALAAGLIDSIGTFQDAKKAAKDAQMRGTKDESPAVLAGVLGDNVWGPFEWGEPPHIALLYGIGPCDMDSGIRGRLLSSKIRAAREDPAVRAVVFRADSPGGDPLPSDLVARELKETAKKKPVIVSQGQVAGSGGYWISMYGDKIVASPVTITGSIGVIGAWFWNDGFGEKIGLNYDGVKRGEHADLGAGIRLPIVDEQVPDRPLTQQEHDRMESLIRTMYKDFVAKVAEGRGMSNEEVDSVGQGRVWSGKRGREIGLVDQLGGLWSSLRIAKEAAGIPADDPVVISEGPQLGLLNLEMFTPKLLGVDLEEAHARSETLLTDEEVAFLRHAIRSKGQPLLMMEPLGLDGSVAGDRTHP